MFSDKAIDVLKSVLNTKSGGSNLATYEVTTNYKSSTNSRSTIASVSLSFKNEIEEEDVNKLIEKTAFPLLGSSLDVVGLAAADVMLQKFTSKKPREERKRGHFKVNIGESGIEPGFEGSITTSSGKFISNLNLKNVLELMAKEELIKYMQNGGASLKYRTGRFANSLKLNSISVDPNKSEDLTIGYGYMTRPYSVFNPFISTYRQLSLRPYMGARNPQKLIGNAIAKAAQNIIHSKYNINIKES